MSPDGKQFILNLSFAKCSEYNIAQEKYFLIMNINFK